MRNNLPRILPWDKGFRCFSCYRETGSIARNFRSKDRGKERRKGIAGDRQTGGSRLYRGARLRDRITSRRICPARSFLVHISDRIRNGMHYKPWSLGCTRSHDPRKGRDKFARKGKSRADGFAQIRRSPRAPTKIGRFAIFRRTSVETYEARDTVPWRSRIVYQRRHKMQLGYEPRVCHAMPIDNKGDHADEAEENVGITGTRIRSLLPGRGAMISIRFWSQVLRQSGTHDWLAPRHARVRKTVISQRVLIKRPVAPTG